MIVETANAAQYVVLLVRCISYSLAYVQYYIRVIFVTYVITCCYKLTLANKRMLYVQIRGKNGVITDVYYSDEPRLVLLTVTSLLATPLAYAHTVLVETACIYGVDAAGRCQLANC